MTPMPNAPSPNAIFGEALARTPAPLPLSTVEEQLAQTRGLNAQVPVQQQQAQELALKNQLTQRKVKNLQIMHDNLPGLLQASGGKWDDSVFNGLVAKGLDADEGESLRALHLTSDDKASQTAERLANAQKTQQDLADHARDIAGRQAYTLNHNARNPDGSYDPVKVEAVISNLEASDPQWKAAGHGRELRQLYSTDQPAFAAKMQTAEQLAPEAAKEQEQLAEQRSKTAEAASTAQLRATQAQEAALAQRVRERFLSKFGSPVPPGAPIAAAGTLNSGVAGAEDPDIAGLVSNVIDRKTYPAEWQEGYGHIINSLGTTGDFKEGLNKLGQIAERISTSHLAQLRAEAENAPTSPVFKGKAALAGAEEEQRQNVALKYLNAQGGTSQLAKDIADYKVPLTTALSNRIPLPARDAILAEVNRLNPDFNASNFAIKQRTENDAITGKIGTQRSALNTMMGHLSILDQAADALNNSDFPALNRIANYLGVQVGGTAKTTYETIVHRLGPEVTRAYVAGGGSVGERGTNESDFSPSLAPGQLKANVGVSAQLAGSLVDALENRYKGGTFGRGNLQTLLSPEAQAARQQLAGQSPVGRTAPPMPRVLTAADVGKTYTKGGKVWRITRVNPADGTKFLADEVR